MWSYSSQSNDSGRGGGSAPGEVLRDRLHPAAVLCGAKCGHDQFCGLLEAHRQHPQL